MPKNWLLVIRSSLIVGVVGARLLGRIGQVGQIWGEIALVVGWMVGYLLAELDHLFYVTVCNPQELSCQKIKYQIASSEYKQAWTILKETAGERTRLPVHNVLTGLVVAVLGLWIVTSSGSLLAGGVVAGLGVKLLTDLWADREWGKWYWIFTREFSQGENRTIMGVWALLVFMQLISLARG